MNKLFKFPFLFAFLNQYKNIDSKTFEECLGVLYDKNQTIKDLEEKISDRYKKTKVQLEYQFDFKYYSKLMNFLFNFNKRVIECNSKSFIKNDGMIVFECNIINFTKKDEKEIIEDIRYPICGDDLVDEMFNEYFKKQLYVISKYMKKYDKDYAVSKIHMNIKMTIG